MKFHQAATIKGGQDGAIFGKYLFRFNHKGEGRVYDLELIEKGEAEPIADIIAVTFTSILFVFRFRKAMKEIAPKESV